GAVQAGGALTLFGEPGSNPWILEDTPRWSEQPAMSLSADPSPDPLHAMQFRPALAAQVRRVQPAQRLSKEAGGSPPDEALTSIFAGQGLCGAPPPESNRRPHPYHGSAAKRRANPRCPRSLATVDGEVMCSVETAWWSARRRL